MALFTNDKNCISTGLRADIMRSSMEDKNLLEGKGSIYVGTGERNTLDDGTTQVIKTKALAVDTTAGKVLMSSGSDLVYSTLLNSSFNASTRYTNLKWVNGTNGSTVDGLTLAQNSSTGYITLSGYINKLYSADGSSALITASSDTTGSLLLVGSRMKLTSGGIISSGDKTIITPEGRFYTPDQGNQQLRHAYHHHVVLTLKTTIGVSLLQGAVFAFDFANSSSTKYTSILTLGKVIPIGYTNSGYTAANVYEWDTYVTPSGILLNESTGSVPQAVAYVQFKGSVTSGAPASTTCYGLVRFVGSSGVGTYFYNSQTGAAYISSITDTVTYLDTGVAVS